MKKHIYLSALIACLWSAPVMAAQPVLDNGIGAAPVGFFTATLNGNLTDGLSASNYVFWGTTDGGAAWDTWANTNSVGLCNVGAFRAAVTNLTPGTVYYYRCYGTNTDGEAWSSETATFTTKVGLDSFVGGSYDGFDRKSAVAAFGNLFVNNADGATNVTDSSAWLNGTLLATSAGEAADVRVYWGTNDGATNKGGWAHADDLGSGTEGQVFTANVSVNPSATYYYRFYATNAAGEGWAGDSASFVTPGTPVVNTGIGATPVGFSTATLNGNLTAGISASNYVFWGTTDGGAVWDTWDNTNSAGLCTVGAFRAAVANLAPGTVYYYRCYGTNFYGEGWSAVATFTTPVGLESFVGGSYDGFDQKSAVASFGNLFVNNADGATNVTDSSAWLNGTLVATGGEAADVRVYWGTNDGTTNKGNWAHADDLGSGTEGQVFTANVSVNPSATYYYRFYATNAAGEGWAGDSASFVTPGTPVVNTGIGATPVGFSTATLNGNLTAGISASNYVFWGTTDGGAAWDTWDNTNSVGLCTVGAFRTPVANLAPGTVYYYRCYGTNFYGEGWSAVATFTTPVGLESFVGGSYDGFDRKSAVASFGNLFLDNANGATNVNATDLSAWLNGTLLATSTGETANVRVYWGANDGATDKGSWAHMNDFGSGHVEGQAFSANVSVYPDATFYYRFYATNVAGEGWAGDSASFSFAPVTMPDMPTNILASDGIYTDKITVAWSAAKGASGYKVLRSINNDINTVSFTNLVNGGSTTNCDDPAVEQGVLYYYWIRATNTVGVNDSDTNAAGFLALPSPMGLSVSSGIYAGKVGMTWTAVNGANGYEVYRNTADSTSGVPVFARTTATNYDDTTVTVDVDYYYWIKATNNLSASAFSAGARGYAASPPYITIQPQSRTNNTGSSASFTVAASGTAPLYYQWQKDTVNIAGVTAVSYTINSVASGDAGSYRCLVSNMLGAVTSAAAILTVNAESDLPSPTGVSASQGMYTNKVLITWSAASGATGYQIFRYTSDSSAEAKQIGTATSTTYDDTGALADITYYYWVKAKNSARVSAFSSSTPGWRAPSETAPSVPTGVRASDGTYTNKVVVTWNVASGASGYQVWRHTANNSTAASQLGTTAFPTYDDIGALADITYYYWVKATNTAGVSAFSPSDTGWRAPSETVLPAPTGVSASDGTYTNKIAVTWSAVNGATGYQVWRAGENNIGLAVNLGNAAAPGYDDNSSAVRSATMFYYWIKAMNSVATSEFSSVESGFCKMTAEIISGQPMQGDYDGDGICDPAVYNLENGRLFVWLSSAGYVLVTPVTTFQVTAGDLPVTGDFDGDRLSDPGVFNRASSSWHIWLSSAGYFRVGPLSFGISVNDIPVPADYDGDGKTDPAVYQTSSGGWYIWLSSAGYYRLGPFNQFNMTLADTPVPGRYIDGTAPASPAVYQTASGNWYFWFAGSGYARIGPANMTTSDTHLPVPGDYDGDGICDPAVYVPSKGEWIIWESSSGYSPATLAVK